VIAQAVVCRELIGRDAELAHLHERRREASRAHGGLVLVAGEAGVGKSRLLAEFRASLAGARVRAVASHCRQYAQRPYGPILDALEQLDPARGHLQPAQSRGERFERIVNAFLAAAQRRCVIALIEDIHWTDAASIEQLAALAATAASERLLLVASYRPEASADATTPFAGDRALRKPPRREPD
jgi:predicted ATPase